MAIIKVFRLVGINADDFGLVVSRLNGNHIDPEWRQFNANRLREADQSVFAGGISGVKRVSDQSGERGDIDDASTVFFYHAERKCLG